MAVISKKAYLGHRIKKTKTSSESDSSPPSPNWSELPIELWESILNRLFVGDLLSAGAVCRSWCSVAEARKSSLESPLFDQPLLLLPGPDQGKKNSRCLYNFTEKKVYKQMMNIPENLGNCKGSSHGWLIFLDHEAFPHIFSPFLGARIQLPLFEICKTSLHCFFVQDIKKVVLSSYPSHSKNNFWVGVIYGVIDRKLAFWKCGDNEWTALDGAHQAYCDIISHHDHIIALGETASVEIWDFNNSVPVKKMQIEPIFPEKKVEFENSLGDLYTIQSYIVESKGDLLLIVRYIGNHVRWDGVVVHEADLLDEENQCWICPYLTKLFHVYKLHFGQKKWVQVASLGDDLVLFLGRNQSVSHSAKSFPSCKGNSIYFTDDYYSDVLAENDMYGHDTGRFDMENQSIELIDEDDWEKIQAAPIWVVPNSC
ncbi:putative F-box protein At4g17565 [Cornus florida]|uniref:putative F-box protein At4g17565 n=1 Tax=Cornus florida TaxID=4283 RepID=UPI0028A030F1|nr:putative F-box protein At4g17565 [Cornus florida]